MSKVFSVYSNKVDKVWYQSSNIKYSECIDNENQPKTLKVVFNNGTQYQYNNVDVNHYLLFREDVSQGKALNKFIKGNNYEYVKLDNANMESIDDELNFRIEGGHFVYYNGKKLVLKDNKDNVLLEREVKLTSEAFNAVCATINALGKEIYTDGQNFYELKDDGEEGDA